MNNVLIGEMREITRTKRTEYVINSQPELSQVLQSVTTDSKAKDSKQEITYYFYGKGLQSQENDTDGYLTYHFNNVGSAMAVTDSEGKVVETYNYTPYGELIDGTYSDNIAFLYNGQYGVATDDNGLYYMRARYYNVDIKRFVNQDVLTGTLERISSLNRYAYVEGNPVSFLDPFGLAKSIYDDWHNYLQDILELYSYVSAATMILFYVFPEAGYVVSTAIGIDAILVACMDLGVCIGRAWEGVSENNYEKIDSSYMMMKDVVQSLLLTLNLMVLDSFYDKPVFSFINDLVTMLESLTEKYQ